MLCKQIGLLCGRTLSAPSRPGDCKYVSVRECSDCRNEQKTLVCLIQGGIVCLCFEWMRVAFCKRMHGVSWIMEQWITKGYATKKERLQVMMKWCFIIICWDVHFNINKIQISCALTTTRPVKKCSHLSVYCMVYTTLVTCCTLSSDLPFRYVFPLYASQTITTHHRLFSHLLLNVLCHVWHRLWLIIWSN